MQSVNTEKERKGMQGLTQQGFSEFKQRRDGEIMSPGNATMLTQYTIPTPFLS